ncbi:MAG TPA: sensor domain-containing diguanylate cyclase [Nevskiaceae bacterium]|nr:sensor domain-containing diguanylate cyclase [Nevskiaceae bacterium]
MASDAATRHMEALLSRLADSVSGADTLESLTRPLLELLELVTGLESTYLTTIDEPGGVQQVLFARNSRQMQIPEGLSVPWDDTLCKRALLEGRPYTDNVSTCWGDSQAAQALGIRTYVSQPVHNLDGALYGTLCAAGSESVALGPSTLKVLGLFSRLIAHQVERERIVESLRHDNERLSSHALTDSLTGVPNRRALQIELQRVIARTRREGSRVQIAFIDLDGFKAINDHYGHEAGDRFLAHMAARLAGSIRRGDFLARYGGDEFVVVAANAAEDNLRGRLEQLTVGRFVSQGLCIDYGGASVGVVVAEPDEHDAEALLARADAAMYEVKRQRRAERAH